MNGKKEKERSVIIMENRFEGCKVLWGKRYRGTVSRVIRYAEAVIETKDGKLYYVDASLDFGEWEVDVSVNVHLVEKFDKETKQVKRKRGFVAINSKEWEYLEKLLLSECDSNAQDS